MDILDDKVLIIAAVHYLHSSNGTLRWLKFSLNISKDVTNNPALYNIVVRNRSLNNISDSGDYGHSNIQGVSPSIFPGSHDVNINDILMTLNKNNDCTIKELYNDKL